MKFLPVLICSALACGRAALAQAEISTATITAPDASARLEERLRGAYINFFRSGKNPEGRAAARHNPACKWRWEYYSLDLEGHCAKVLGVACPDAAMAGLKHHDYPEIEEFYKTLIARQQKARPAILAKLTPARKK